MSDNSALSAAVQNLQDAFSQSTPDEIRDALRGLVAGHYPTVPWANKVPSIQDTAQADVGVGVVMYYQHPDGDLRLVMMEPNGPNEGKIQIPGGFKSFATTETERDPETALVNDLGVEIEPEQQLDAVIREIGEELRGEEGPFFEELDKDRFIKLDQKTIWPGGAAREVNGYGYELNAQEYGYLESLEHQQKLGQRVIFSEPDEELKAFHIVKARDVFDDPSVLAHPDQLSLFERLQGYLRIEDPQEKLEYVLEGLR